MRSMAPTEVYANVALFYHVIRVGKFNILLSTDLYGARNLIILRLPSTFGIKTAENTWRIFSTSIFVRSYKSLIDPPPLPQFTFFLSFCSLSFTFLSQLLFLHDAVIPERNPWIITFPKSSQYKSFSLKFIIIEYSFLTFHMTFFHDWWGRPTWREKIVTPLRRSIITNSLMSISTFEIYPPW